MPYSSMLRKQGLSSARKDATIATSLMNWVSSSTLCAVCTQKYYPLLIAQNSAYATTLNSSTNWPIK